MRGACPGCSLSPRCECQIRRNGLFTAWSLTPVSIFPVFPVILSLIACKDMEFNKEGNSTPHYLGIKDKNLCLHCTEIQGYPTLQLKVSGCAAN